MLGDLELKNDDWVKAKETFRAASEASEGKHSYDTLSLVRLFFQSACISETFHCIACHGKPTFLIGHGKPV